MNTKTPVENNSSYFVESKLKEILRVDVKIEDFESKPVKIKLPNPIKLIAIPAQLALIATKRWLFQENYDQNDNLKN